MSINKIASITAGLVLIVGISATLLVRASPSNETRQAAPTTTSATKPGVIAVLGNNNSFVSPDQANTTTPQVNGAQTTDEAVPEKYSALPYELGLPDTWTVSAPVECAPDSLASATTYTNQSQTIVVYTNTRPENCGGAQSADTYLDYDFTDNDAAILVRTDAITQCSKTDNPTCPKGDGKVSVFIGNQSAVDATVDTKNKLTDKTYSISIVDTNISGDFKTQVTALASLIQLKIN
jgi:hypothetical protein